MMNNNPRFGTDIAEDYVDYIIAKRESETV